jgi:phage/plasmid-like protein (TIGR03299 family)
MAIFAETMYDRTKAWEGLGTDVKEAANSADALKLAGLDWTVEQRPVYLGNEPTPIPNYKANVRDKDNKVLGIVTDRYQIVQNTEAFSFTDSLIGGDVRYETAGSLKGGKRIWLLAKMPTARVAGDDVDPYLCFTNTHDGSGSVKVCVTPVRIWCMNTLNLALRTAKRSWSMKHVGALELKLREARMTLELADRYMLALDEEAERLANVTVTDEKLEKILNEMFPLKEDATERQKDTVKAAKDEIMIAYFMPDIAKFRGTAWGVVNAVADMVDHSKPQRNTQNYRENNWGRIMDGHHLLDMVTEKVMALA